MAHSMTPRSFATVMAGVLAFVIVDNMITTLVGGSRWRAHWDSITFSYREVRKRFRRHSTAARRMGMSRPQSALAATWRCRQDSAELALCVIMPVVVPVFLIIGLVVVPLIMWANERKHRSDVEKMGKDNG